jgi:hypothetical protein
VEIFKQLIAYLALASLGFTLVEVYLRANRLWKQKHESAVAESISILAMFISFLPGLLFALNYLLATQWQGFVRESLYLLIVLFTVLVGMKLWVPEEQGKGFFTLLRQALNLERQEVGDLAKAIFKPAQHETIIRILGQVALIDHHLDDREKKLIDAFAQQWAIVFSWSVFQSETSSDPATNYIKLRQGIEDYLVTAPPNEQVMQLKDIISWLINIDQDVSDAEKLVVSELNGMFINYQGKEETLEQHYVVVMPQNEQQETTIAQMLPELTRYTVAQGCAYHSQPFYSKEFAKIFSDQYRTLDLFSLVTGAL